MRKGRTGRSRKRHKIRQEQQRLLDIGLWADLRKWMVSRSSKCLLMNTFKLVPFNFPETGRGLKTKAAVTPGTVIVDIPFCLLLTPSTVLNSPYGALIKSWCIKFTPHQLLALFLIVEFSRGMESEWYPLIASFPAKYTLPHYFSQEELKSLPLLVVLEAEKLIQRSLLAHKQVVQFINIHWKDTDNWACWERFRWAWCTVSSRSVFLEAEKGLEKFMDLDIKDENNVALCPYLDLLNHISTASVRAGMNWQNGTYEIIADNSYEVHDQVFINYGPHDNVTLFLHYGFTLPHNVHNSVCFTIDDLMQLREVYQIACWEQRIAILQKHGLHGELCCTDEGASWKMISALKILSMDWKQLQKSETVITGELLQPSVELSAHCMAKYLIGQTLTRSQMLLKKQLEDDLSAHSLLARNLLLDEISILTASLQLLS